MWLCSCLSFDGSITLSVAYYVQVPIHVFLPWYGTILAKPAARIWKTCRFPKFIKLRGYFFLTRSFTELWMQ